MGLSDGVTWSYSDEMNSLLLLTILYRWCSWLGIHATDVYSTVRMKESPTLEATNFQLVYCEWMAKR